MLQMIGSNLVHLASRVLISMEIYSMSGGSFSLCLEMTYKELSYQIWPCVWHLIFECCFYVLCGILCRGLSSGGWKLLAWETLHNLKISLVRTWVCVTEWIHRKRARFMAH
jgi:hypothetical protein